MSKRALLGILFVIIALSLSATSCGTQVGIGKKPNNSSPNPLTSKPSVTTPPITTTSSPPIKPSITPSPISTTPKVVPPVSVPDPIAQIITVDMPVINTKGIMETRKVNEILFYNNSSDYVVIIATVRLRNPDGSFLSETSVRSEIIPPESHAISLISIANALSQGIPGIANTQIESQKGYTFAKMAVRDLRFKSDNSLILYGSLFNLSNVTPKQVGILVWKRRNDNSIVIVGSFDPISKPPPPGEFVNVQCNLRETIVIKDAKNGVIEGEISIVAPS